MKTCIALVDISSGAASACGNVVEGTTDFCAHHNRENRKSQERFKKNQEKRAAALERQKNQKPKKAISRDPKNWSNTFLCSDGVRVTQVNINQMYSSHRGRRKTICEGCQRAKAVCNAHIIAKARCKKIGKTELIWDGENMFDACFECNFAIENPKGKAWKSLKNIDKCLSFIKEHDPELYTKFELSEVTQSKETI